MYYPYLRAKQYELKALKEFSAEHIGQDVITPILEPVKQQTNALATATNEMLENGMKFALILNPNDGDFRHHTVQFDMWHQNETLMDRRDGWIPAFIYSRRSAETIIDTINNYNLEDVMIVFRTGIEIDDTDAWNIINNENIKYVVNAFGTTQSRRLKRKLDDIIQTKELKVICLNDCFKQKARNADYLQEEDEFFSEEPFYYADGGFFSGYSDYTALPSEYIEGGMLPYALVIHLTYKKNEDQLYVHHFVSDSNNSYDDVRGKFFEASRKIGPFFSEKNIEKTNAIEEIIEKSNDPNGYPGLGYLKKLSIKNHLELILSLPQR